MSPRAHFFGFVRFESFEYLSLLVLGNNFIGHSEKNVIFLLDMLPQQCRIRSCVVQERVLRGCITRLQ